MCRGRQPPDLSEHSGVGLDVGVASSDASVATFPPGSGEAWLLAAPLGVGGLSRGAAPGLGRLGAGRALAPG